MKGANREFALALTVFSKEPFGISFGGSQVDVYQLGIAALGFIYFFNLKRSFQLLASIGGLVGLSLIAFGAFEYSVTNIFVRQVLAVTFIYIGLGAFVMNCSRSKLIIAYLQVCYFAATFGLLQVLLSIFGVDILIKIPMRLDSLSAEPSHYAVAIAPAVYYCCCQLNSVENRIRAFVILGSLMLTVSATAVAVLCSAIAFSFYGKRAVVGVVVLLAAYPVAARIPPDIFPEVIASRIVSMQKLLETDRNPWDTGNLTVLSFATNFDVMLNTLEQGRFLGNGFCGHVEAYANRFEDTKFRSHSHYGINAPAAHCFVIRVISEFGVLGIGFILFVLLKAASSSATEWHMYLAMAITARAFKLGSWIDYGLPIFLLAAFYLSARAKQMGSSRFRVTATSFALAARTENMQKVKI